MTSIKFYFELTNYTGIKLLAEKKKKKKVLSI